MHIMTIVQASNLIKHVCECDHIAPPRSGTITRFAQGSSYTPHKLWMKIALWVAHHNCPFAIIEGSELLDIFYDLNSKVVGLSQYTMSKKYSRWVRSRLLKFEGLKILLFILSFLFLIVLKAYPWKFHICADGQTSPNVVAFVGITVHWVLEGQISSLILNFVKYVPYIYCCCKSEITSA